MGGGRPALHQVASYLSDPSVYLRVNEGGAFLGLPVYAGVRQAAGEALCEFGSKEISPLEETLSVTLVRGHHTRTVSCTLASFHPRYSSLGEAGSFVLSARLFSEVIAQVVFAACTDESVPVGGRVFLNVWLRLPGDETLTLAAADQSQLALRKVKAPGAVVPHATLQIPAAALAALAVLLTAAARGEEGCLVRTAWSSSTWRFTGRGAR